ncbi:MAG: monofunctional biosynthetic peptidoglycan transglycosylase [Nitrospinae bacterium CG11_big_fil_rev_8_21_14_0_20_56_8]|nr:MAG: monofunctional biosynthetic peptidoglycan transglycosylase [Nitrospinae bacterium CG11_big_fil_rev_8_21_14_0_20_56_8]
MRVHPGRLLFDLLLCFLAFTVVPVLLYNVFDPPTTALMWIRWTEQDRSSDFPRAFQHWTRLDEVSPHLIRAVIASEDQKFFHHRGFDWQAIEAAVKTNLTTDRRVGASTISMQTARNVFLWQKRNWLRKGLEAYFTVLIEALWSKQRILEVYLNVIEWGDGIFGCEAAARAYFNRSAQNLSPVEAAALAAVLPNPRAWSVVHPQDFVEDRQARILDVMSKVNLPRLK